MMWTKKYLLKAIKYYRNLDFFQEEEYKILSESKLVEEFLKKKGYRYQGFKSCYIDDCCYDDIEYDWLIVKIDLKLTLTVATDILYHDAPPAYNFGIFCETLEELENISRGIFRPHSVENIGDKYVSFIWNSNKYNLLLEGGCDDPLILARQINPIIYQSGYQFQGNRIKILSQNMPELDKIRSRKLLFKPA